ncbi:MAG: hypothetical protein AAFV62_05750 [Pseudomonadota bacterium]
MTLARIAARFSVLAAAFALLLAFGADRTLAEDAQPLPDGPATQWRFLSGPGIDGVLRPAMAESGELGVFVGFLILNIQDKGSFVGLYNVREDGTSLVGAFWPEGQESIDIVSGIIDIGGAPNGELSGREGRITFLNQDTVLDFNAM